MIKEKIIINDHIQGDPLSEENLDKTLDFLFEIRLLLTEKTIWLYTGYKFMVDIPKSKQQENKIFSVFPNALSQGVLPNEEYYKQYSFDDKRMKIISQCDILVDGRYIDSQRDITKKWAGSKNQRVISIKESLQKGEVVLYCD